MCLCLANQRASSLTLLMSTVVNRRKSESLFKMCGAGIVSDAGMSTMGATRAVDPGDRRDCAAIED